SCVTASHAADNDAEEDEFAPDLCQLDSAGAKTTRHRFARIQTRRGTATISRLIAERMTEPMNWKVEALSSLQPANHGKLRPGQRRDAVISAYRIGNRTGNYHKLQTTSYDYRTCCGRADRTKSMFAFFSTTTTSLGLLQTVYS